MKLCKMIPLFIFSNNAPRIMISCFPRNEQVTSYQFERVEIVMLRADRPILQVLLLHEVEHVEWQID